MIIERDVPITVDDGLILRADVFRPDDNTPAPVIMNLGPYGKGVEYKTGYTAQWDWILKKHPNLLSGSQRRYMTWETVDPELWTKWGYAVVRVDSRGAGRSPGHIDIYAPREIKDFYDAIEWAGTQQWSNGKVGLSGISYYAITQWLVATLQPPHLTAMIPWEGSADAYRDMYRHGGIASNAFLESWFHKQVVSAQHGNPDGYQDPWLNERATGPATLSNEELIANRQDPVKAQIAHSLDDKWYRDRSADWTRIKTPFLSAANWGAFGLHQRGNFEAFEKAASDQKWLEIHVGRHDEAFYLDEAIELQKRFFDHFLFGVDNGWQNQPRVQMHIRHAANERFGMRQAEEWPLSDTKWNRLFLSSDKRALSHDPPVSASTSTFQAKKETLQFTYEVQQEIEIAGPLAAKLFISSSTSDADIFITVQVFAPDGREVDFQGSWDSHTPIAQGWLRASHRKLDSKLSKLYKPYHTHDESQPLVPDSVYELDVEIWQTNIVLPAEYKIVLNVSGHDFERPARADTTSTWRDRGSGPFQHNHPEDRGSSVFSGFTTVYSGPDTLSYMLVPTVSGDLE